MAKDERSKNKKKNQGIISPPSHALTHESSDSISWESAHWLAQMLVTKDIALTGVRIYGQFMNSFHYFSLFPSKTLAQHYCNYWKMGDKGGIFQGC